MVFVEGVGEVDVGYCGGLGLGIWFEGRGRKG